jgi:hypothetical protein
MILCGFKAFLNEAKTDENNISMILSERLKSVLLQLPKNPIGDELLHLPYNKKKYDISFVDIIEDKDDFFSYIHSHKAKPILDKFKSIKKDQEGINYCWVHNRQKQRISRFITRIFGAKFTQPQIEEFIKNYKAVLKADQVGKYFAVVEGKDVTKYYNGGTYSKESTGQLQRSCMKYDESKKFFTLYDKNPEKMKMLILKEPEGDKIYGRANLWYLDEPVGRIYMDRIYTTYDWQIKLFIDYAIKNDFIYKSKQIYGGSVIPVIDKGKEEKIIMTVNLKKIDHTYYPYVDTLQFYNPQEAILTSDVSKFNKKGWLALVLANGEPYVDNNYDFGMDYLGRIVYHEYLVWSEYDQVYVHRNDAVVLNYRNDYVTPEHEFVKIGSSIYLKNDVEKNEETGEYRVKKNF